MPGLAGFVAPVNNPEIILRNMQDIITHHDFYVKDRRFVADEFGCTRSHINVIQKANQPFSADGVHIWLDGEFYNQSDLVKETKPASTDLGILYELYKNNADFSFLKSIDGIYSAVIYDQLKQKLHLIIDRYGLRHLYWSNTGGRLAWASEVKAFLCLPWITPSINLQSVDNFFSVGYLLENRTWFNEVELMPSGTVLSYDLKLHQVEEKRYWWWDEIKPIQGKIDENEVAEELGRLFINAVNRRCREGERVGVTLSGGLDSRAILAAMPEHGAPIHAVTFGKRGCEDIRIAAMAAKLKGAEHHVFEINENNWLAPRITGVWFTDGQFNLLHMHDVESTLFYRNMFDISLNGMAGDGIWGGSFLKKQSQHFNNYGDPYGYRGRKFIILGPKLTSNVLGVRLPFFDNKLLESILAIPEKYRKKSNIYNRSLLKVFRDFFNTIPWQKTGFPISMNPQMVTALVTMKKIKGKVFRLIRKYCPYNYQETTSYTDYNSWLKGEPATTYFYNMLSNKNSIYTDYISHTKVTSELEAHLEGKANYSDKLCRYLTFELWLQQVFNKQHRKWDR
jgi:asparagine synthase (glutamine-hydrolysing)